MCLIFIELFMKKNSVVNANRHKSTAVSKGLKSTKDFIDENITKITLYMFFNKTFTITIE